MSRRWAPLILAALAVLAAAGCSPAASPDEGPVELQVYAAASLRRVLEAVTPIYESANPGVRLTVSTDSSAALTTKIEQGAPADVFLSADMANPGRLVDGALAAGEIVAFAGNHLAVIVPADNPAGIGSPADLARPGVKVIAAAPGVPVTRYTDQLVERLVTDAGYPATFPADYAANVVSREDSVEGIVTKVGLGEGDAGIVYVTDAAASTRVASIPVPAEASIPVTYGGVVVRATRRPDEARAFLAWLAGPDGGEILSAFGFTPVR